MKNALKSMLGVAVYALAGLLPMAAHAKDHSSSSSTESESCNCKESSEKNGYWKALKNQPTFLTSYDLDGNFADPSTPFPGGAYTPMLLTDGTIMFQNTGYFATSEIWKLTPDEFGNYVNGTWSQLASLPVITASDGTVPYSPQSHASAVLPDGRVIFMGGEQNGSEFPYVFTSAGAIYDPILDYWTPVAPPPFFSSALGLTPPNGIGDCASVILEDGTFMLQDPSSYQAALLDAETLTWTETGTASKYPRLNDEEGWTLLPNGKVLTVNCYVESAVDPTDFPYPSNNTGSQIYDPKTGIWSSAGSTIVPLSDPVSFEMGPAVLRPDGTVFCVGAHGTTAIYDSHKGKWKVGPTLPAVPEGQLSVWDGPGALLPNGNVIFVTSLPDYGPPLFIFEFDGKNLTQIPNIPNGLPNRFNSSGGGPNVPPNFPTGSDASWYCEMLLLPTGQVLMIDNSNDVEIYTPSDRSYNPKWAPDVHKSPKIVHGSSTYKIEGIRFNGMSQGAMYGDDYQGATNYPLVRITNCKTGHVFYCRTHDHSFMGVASDRKVHTYFDVPANIESGKSKLEVVANGIPSKPIHIHVSM